MGKDLDQLAEVIAGALQELDEEQPGLGAQPEPGATDSRGEMEGNREPSAAVLLNQDQNLQSDKGQDLNQKDTLKMKQQGLCLCCWKREEKLAPFRVAECIMCNRCKITRHYKFINALTRLCFCFFNPYRKCCQMYF